MHLDSQCQIFLEHRSYCIDIAPSQMYITKPEELLNIPLKSVLNFLNEDLGSQSTQNIFLAYLLHKTVPFQQVKSSLSLITIRSLQSKCKVGKCIKHTNQTQRTIPILMIQFKVLNLRNVSHETEKGKIDICFSALSSGIKRSFNESMNPPHTDPSVVLFKRMLDGKCLIQS
jgi:hypothetical protein